MIRSIKYFFLYCIDLIFPSVCGYCKTLIASKETLCSSCLARIKPIVSAPLIITKKQMASVFSVSDYNYPLRALIQAKNHGNRQVSNQLGELIWSHTSIRYAEFDVIVPIPLHWTRYARRWFNQSYEMAQAISKQSGKPIVQLLTRTKKTNSQTEFSRKNRKYNVQKVFALTQEALNYKKIRILLIDDVMTTGSTLQSAFHALIPLQPLGLSAAVVCRVINK